VVPLGSGLVQRGMAWRSYVDKSVDMQAPVSLDQSAETKHLSQSGTRPHRLRQRCRERSQWRWPRPPHSAPRSLRELHVCHESNDGDIGVTGIPHRVGREILVGHHHKALACFVA
jgi:hypothetical protein